MATIIAQTLKKVCLWKRILKKLSLACLCKSTCGINVEDIENMREETESHVNMFVDKVSERVMAQLKESKMPRSVSQHFTVI